ncbi:MAG: ATP-binding protein [Spirochaetes bacterium]|nr:ATP-binding protein [Spirochaetota bacterium]
MNSISIAFASGKGGTGKTSLAANFAKFLSHEKNVLLSDLDVEEPNVSIFFPENEKPGSSYNSKITIPEVDLNKCTYCGKCAQKCNFNAIAVYQDKISIFQELCKGCGRCSNICEAGAINLIESEVGKVNEYSSESLEITEGILNTGNIHTKSLITDVKKYRHRDINIYDCPPGTTCPMVESVLDADFTVLVTEPTPFGLHDLSLAVEVMEKLNKKFGVIINKSGDNDHIIEDYCKKGNYDILEKIPFDRTIAEKCGRGEFYYDDENYRIKMNNIYNHITGKIK